MEYSEQAVAGTFLSVILCGIHSTEVTLNTSSHRNEVIRVEHDVVEKLCSLGTQCACAKHLCILCVKNCYMGGL